MNESRLTPRSRPPSFPFFTAGTIFLFDRKAVRFFRKDGHDWQKKKDGKTVRETHEKLKVGNVELLNCYYAHAAENDRFQRRCYWLLDSDEGVVLVHYLDTTMVVGGRGGAKGGATHTMQPNTQQSDSGATDGGDRNGFRNLFRYASGASQMSGSGYDEGSMSMGMGGEMPASPMMHSPARVSVQGGSYHPEVYANSHQYGVVGGSFSQHQHGGIQSHGVMPSHYPHGGSDPHALYHAAQEQFNGAESESWFNSVLPTTLKSLLLASVSYIFVDSRSNFSIMTRTSLTRRHMTSVTGPVLVIVTLLPLELAASSSAACRTPSPRRSSPRTTRCPRGCS